MVEYLVVVWVLVVLFFVGIFLRKFFRWKKDTRRILEALEETEELSELNLAKKIGRQHLDHALLNNLVDCGLIRLRTVFDPQVGLSHRVYSLPSRRRGWGAGNF